MLGHHHSQLLFLPLPRGLWQDKDEELHEVSFVGRALGISNVQLQDRQDASQVFFDNERDGIMILAPRPPYKEILLLFLLGKHVFCSKMLSSLFNLKRGRSRVAKGTQSTSAWCGRNLPNHQFAEQIAQRFAAPKVFSDHRQIGVQFSILSISFLFDHEK